MPLIDQYGGSVSGQAFSRVHMPGVVAGDPMVRSDPEEWVRWRQPYLDDHNRACLSVRALDGEYTRNDSHGGEPRPLIKGYLIQDLMNRGLRVPVTANAATMPLRAWIDMDRVIGRAFRQRLTAAADLEAASTYTVDGMRKLTVETQRASDPGEAVVDMLARTEGRNDTPLIDIISLPLPFTHTDFSFADRELSVSQSTDVAFDTFMAEAAARRNAEMVEDTVIGNVTGVTYGTQTTGYGTHTGTSTVYGYLNFPQRLTKTNMTPPTGGWVANTAYTEILACLQLLRAQFQYGPFMIYHSIDWSPAMEGVFSITGGNNPGETLYTMLRKNPDIAGIKRLDRLTNTYTLIFVALRPEVAQMVIGMPFNMITWVTRGGLEVFFKNLGIYAPRLRADYNGRSGVLVATTA